MPVAKKPAAKKERAANTAKKKAVVKRVPKNQKSPAPRTAVKKVSPTKSRKKSVAKKASSVTAKKAPTRSKTKQSQPQRQSNKRLKTEIPETVTVPTNAPLRSIEKAEVFRSELSLYWQKSMIRVAVVSGFCFLLLGATLSSVSVFALSPEVKNDAQIVSTLSEPLLAQLDVHTAVPESLTEPMKVLFTLTNVHPESVKYYLVNQATQNVLPMNSPKKLENNKYEFILSPNDIDVGHYILHIQYQQLSSDVSTDLGDTVTEAIAEFENPPLHDSTESTQEDTLTTSSKQTEPVRDDESQIDNDTVEPTPENTLIDENQHTTSNEETEIAESNETLIDDTLIDKTDALETPELLPEVESMEDTGHAPQTFSLHITESTVSGVVTIPVRAGDFHNLELYARPITSLNSRFLTTVTERSGNTVFVLNTEAFLPNGTYEIYATGIDVNQKNHSTPSVLLNVKNTSTAPTPTLVEQTPKEAAAVNEEATSSLPSSLTPQDTRRDFAPMELTEQAASDELRTDVQDASDRLLSENAEAITQLLKNYSSARQSGDDILQREAKKAIAEKKSEMTNSSLLDTRFAGIADDVVRTLSEEIDNLQSRIDTFEQIRTQRSAGESALDSDNDGIPDFDELNLYNTDPNNPDTDGDGFTDGVEIMRGFDPLDDTAQAVVEYQSPKESLGLVQSDVLEVTEVIPSLNAIENTNDKTVRAQIKGKGLPNSFVTLYIFSTPTIVTIKTDADGSFVYTLDKELEDGTHDVFVALTDNTGSIVAQSNPFSFIKEAEAFTPVDAAANDQITTDSVVQSATTNSYNTVIGVSVLAFGLILLMLGISLRTKYDEDVLQTDRLVKEDMSKLSSTKITT